MSWQVKSDPADRVFSQYIRTRDKECRRCHSVVRFNEKGLPVSHQNSHFQGRRKESTRFDERNCDTLCTGCHGYFTEHPVEHLKWQIEMKGQELVDELILTGNTPSKKRREFWKIYWTQRLKELK